MAAELEKKISGFTTLATANDALQLLVNNGGTSRKVTWATLKANGGTPLLTVDNISPGFISQNQIKLNGNDIEYQPYKMETNGVVYSDASVDVLDDVTTLTASTKYAVCMNEATGNIAIVLVSAFDNWSVSGNQLNARSIYDPVKNYMVDTVAAGSPSYRVLIIFKVNAGSTGFDWALPVDNYPKTRIACYRGGTTQTISGATVIIDFNTIVYDMNSEVTTGAAWKVTLDRSSPFIVDVATLSATGGTSGGAGELAGFWLYVNGVQKKRLDEITTEAAGRQRFSLHGSYTAELKESDYIDIRLSESLTGGTANYIVFNSEVYSYIEITETEN